jgi:hypothetical protein
MPERNSTFAEMFVELGFAATEVIAHRSLLIASGTCPAEEFQLMVIEKAALGFSTGARLAAGADDPADLLSPWHGTVLANAKRLRDRMGN